MPKSATIPVIISPPLSAPLVSQPLFDPIVGQQCPVCHGSGINPNHPGVMCNYCAGSGQMPGS
jgi:hypothetical protein